VIYQSEDVRVTQPSRKLRNVF